MRRRKCVTRREFMKESAFASGSVLASGIATPFGHERSVSTLGNEAAESHTLENEFLRIEINPGNGAITGLFNKRTGKEYIAAPIWARSFRLNVPDRWRVTGYNADWSANALDSWRQASCSIAIGKNAQGQIITVRYPQLESAAGKFPIEVEYSIRLPNKSEDAFLKLSVVNHSRFCVREVFFPWISGLGEVEGADYDTLVVPNIIRSISELRKDSDQPANWEEYPYLLGVPQWPSMYSLSMPWLNYGGKGEGFYFASLDREGIQHMLMIQDFGAGQKPILAFGWAFPPYIQPGKSWQTPEIVLSLHGGDWHVAADKYRASLDGWYRKPHLTLDSKRTFASFNSFFTKRDFMQIADLAEDIKNYGLNDLVMWNFGDYYPNVLEEDDLSVDPPRLGEFTSQWGGLTRLKKANQIAETQGVRTGIIFSQRLWNIHTLTPELRRLADKWVLRTASGDPITESWAHEHLGAGQWSYEKPYFGYAEYCMCDAVKEYREFAIHNVVGVLDRGGYSTMFFDQSVESNLCFNPEHDHATVSAPSVTSQFFVSSLRKAMHQKNPNWRLVGEGWELLASQGMDMGWVWSGQPNAEVLRYTLPWVRVARAVDVDPGDANRNFVLGVHLAVIPKGIESGKKLSDFPKFAEHMARLSEFQKRTERFWVNGVFEDDLGLKLSGGFGKIYKTPTEVALMIANLASRPSDANFELDSRRHDIDGISYSIVSSNWHNEEASAEKIGNQLKVSKSLRPYEVIAVVFSRRRHNEH
jgi:hypothetical protein